MNNNMNLSLVQMNEILQDKYYHIPPKLFKYREINNEINIEENKHVDALKNENIYLSNPYYFNDPYDSAFSINIEKFKDNLIKNMERRIKGILLKNLFEENNIDLNLFKNKSSIIDEMNLNMRDIGEDLVENNMQTFYEELVKQEINFKISCFSET